MLRRLLPIVFFTAAAFAQDVSPVIQNRISNFRDIGASYKNIADELHADQPDLSKVRTSAKIIADYSVHLPEWFPKGSEAPVKPPRTWSEWFASLFSSRRTTSAVFDSHAKPEIWILSARFRADAQRFRDAAGHFDRTAKGSDLAAIRDQFKALGSSCQACHSQFREKLH